MKKRDKREREKRQDQGGDDSTMLQECLSGIADPRQQLKVEHNLPEIAVLSQQTQ